MEEVLGVVIRSCGGIEWVDAMVDAAGGGDDDNEDRVSDDEAIALGLILFGCHRMQTYH